MASGIYTAFKANLFKRLHNLNNTDTIKVALYGASFAFTASQTIYSANFEIAGTGGYTTAGVAMTNTAVTTNTTNAVFDGDDASWAASTFSTYFAVLYDVTPCNTLICAIDFGGVQTVSAGTFTIQFASSGIVILI